MTTPAGLILNEDSSHFFTSRSAQEMTREQLLALVDQYAGTQVTHLFLNPNSQRTSYRSQVWDPIWEHGKQNPPADDGGKHWCANARRLDEQGLDPYAIWTARAYEKGISPWLSMRMNDVHDVGDPASYIHGSFWAGHPELRRGQKIHFNWADIAFDYGQPAVREYHMKLIREYFDRYDFDGLELDWMRFGYHFRPGHEAAGNRLLTGFIRDVRTLADAHAKRRGHPIKIGVRVPSRPRTAEALGLDPVPWAKAGLIDLVVVTPFWATSEFDMPVEHWKQLLAGTGVTLAAGLEINLRPTPKVWPKYPNNMSNSAETVFGAAAAMLDRGADQIYLFNYMDSETTVDDPADYPKILHHAGALDTLAGQVRRHIVTYPDTLPDGDPPGFVLPAETKENQPARFRIHIGAKPAAGTAQIVLGLGDEGLLDAAALTVKVNDEACAASAVPAPKPIHPMARQIAVFDIPWDAFCGQYNLIEVMGMREKPHQIVWVEIRIAPRHSGE